MDRNTYNRAHALVLKITRLEDALYSETSTQNNEDFDTTYPIEFNMRQSKERCEWLKNQIAILNAELKGL